MLQRSVLVLLHDLAEEGGINGVQDVQDELAIALLRRIIREVLGEVGMLGNHLDEALLGGVPVVGHAHLLNLVVVEGLLLALEDLDQELAGGQALQGKTELSYRQRGQEADLYLPLNFITS